MKNKLLLFLIGMMFISQSIFAQVPSYVPTNGLVGYWPFSGNANDVSGNGNNGTVNGATLTTDRNGNGDSAYYFSSSGCSTRIDANVNTSSIQTGLTISVWVLKVNDGCSSARFFEFWPGVNGPGQTTGWWGNPNPNNIIGIDNTTSNGTVCGYGFPAVANDVWTHLIYTNDGVKARFYQDGIFKGEVSSSGNLSLASSLAIGRMNHPAFDAFNGKIDDFGIWNRALTQQEITSLYTGLPQYSDTCNNVSGSLTQGLVGYWPFCGNANDDSGNGNNGTVNGATLTTDRFGNANSAYSFDGVDDNINLGVNPNISLLPNTNLSISLWFKNINNSGAFISKYRNGVPDDSSFFIGSTWNNEIHFGGNGTAPFPICNSIPNSDWNNMTILFYGGNAQLYLNGIYYCNANFPINTTLSNLPLILGSTNCPINDPNCNFLNGQLDDIGIWNRALTPQEITQLYNQNQCFTNITVTDTLVINVGQLSYTNPIAYANNITIAPNPASTQVNISFNNITDLTGGNINIVNSLGQQVATTPITATGTNTSMSLAAWGGAGMYFVQILNALGIVVDVKKSFCNNQLYTYNQKKTTA